jgi:quinoprotein glucose dehydrogenase
LGRGSGGGAFSGGSSAWAQDAPVDPILEEPEVPAADRRPPWWFGLLLVLVGLALTAGGARLAQLGGSVYYLVGGPVTAMSGLLICAGRRSGAWLYLAFTVATLVWAVFEAGFDVWKLVPRIDLPILLALLCLSPAVWRRLGPPGPSAAEQRGADLRRQAGGGYHRTVLASASVVALVGTSFVVAALRQEPAPAHAAPATLPPGTAAADWRHYGGSLAGDRYSALADLDPGNVGELQPAWTYRTGEMRQPDDPPEYTFEATPIKVRDTLFFCTPHNVIVALDAETGEQRWRFDPQIARVKGYAHLTCRGVAYHEAENPAPGTSCPRRIIESTADARLVAVDADTGERCAGFGHNGEVDLTAGMGRILPGFYYGSSAPLVVRNVAVIGGWVADDPSTDEPSGVVRAYDVATGQLVWNFDAGNPDHAEPLPAGQTYTRNSVNSWAPPSADEALGLIYLPMGSQTPDIWGENRTPDSERFGSAIVAVEADTGRVRWSYQTVHHDLWDMDIGGQPSLFDMPTPDGPRPAVTAVTKRGDLFVLDRRTGEPIVPAPEKPVPQGASRGDHTAATQPFSELSFAPSGPLRESDMWGVTPFDQLWCRIEFRSRRHEGVFTPPSEQGSIVYPGHYGVFDWGGIAVDPVRQQMFVTPAYMAFESRLVPTLQSAPNTRAGGLGQTDNATDTASGPSVGHTGASPMAGTPYQVELKPLMSPLRLPCQAPPWGYVAVVDLRTRSVVWQRENGTTRDNMPFHLPIAFAVGVPGLGGPIMTAGGLGFYSGSLDNYLRAYDLASGREIWKARLPAGGQATPMTYRSRVSARQFVVVAAGGHSGLGTAGGDYVIAYARPRSQ